MQKLVECVPNFSEGFDQRIIAEITQAIESVEAVKLLDVDPGADTNRTVITFIGSPEATVEAAFLAIQKASELIDMSKHHGAHARLGATDVCPLVPLPGVALEECIHLAHQLARRVGDVLKIPVYLYEKAATRPERANLATIRKGEYEGLAEKLADPQWQPDYGPARFNAKSGATVIGVREFLIAYNVNLNTKDRRLAHQIALNIREAGRIRRDFRGKIIRDATGKAIKQPGTLKAVKAVGWYIDEYGQAQISMNLVNYKVTPPHIAFDECCRQAERLGLRVTGSELVGLIPLQAMLDAGRYYLLKQGKSSGVPDSELLSVAVQSMGLADLNPFVPEKKIIEYQVAPPFGRLARLSLVEFADETSSDSPAPGGGSVAALAGALGAALSAMVSNLTVGKKGYESVWEALKSLAVQAQTTKNEFLRAIDRDTDAFDGVMKALGLPKKTEEQKSIRHAAIQDATNQAIQVPLSVMKLGVEWLEQIFKIASHGNVNTLSDIAVAALMLRTGVEGAFYNVQINLPGISDVSYRENLANEAEKWLSLAKIAERKVLDVVETRITR